MGRHPAVYLMGRGAIPSRRGFSRGAMRHPGVSGITRPFGRLSRGRGQVLHVLLSRSPLASLRRGVPFDLHVLGAPPAFILSQDRTLRSSMGACAPTRSESGSDPSLRSLLSLLGLIYHLGKGIDEALVAHSPTILDNSAVCNWRDLVGRGIRFSGFVPRSGRRHPPPRRRARS